MSEGNEGEPSVPPTDRGGKNVVDFPPQSIIASIRRSMQLLPSAKRRLLFLAAGIQISLGLLDLLGIALVGVLATVAVSATGISGVPDGVQSLLNAIGLGGLTATQLSALLAFATVFVLIAKTGLSALLQRRIFRFLANRQADVSARLARAFLRRPLSDVQRWTEPEAIYALGGGVGAATVSLLGSAITIAAESFLFLIVGVSLLIVDPVLTLIAIALFAVIVLISHRELSKRGTRNAQVMTEASIDTLAAVSEALQTYREATVLKRRDLYLARYERVIGSYAKASASTAYILEVPKYVLEATLYLAILMLAVVQFLTRDLASAAATVAVFLAAGTRVTPALLRLQGAGITIRNASVQAQPTFYMADFLGLSADDPYVPVANQVPNAAAIRTRIAAGHDDFDASIVVTDVSVTYTDASHPALLDASFSAPAGTSVALVGSTGAGKSTLADVVLGVLQPDAGRVTINGIDPRAAVERWPGAIAYVPQQVALVFGSVRDNVALGLPREAIDDQLVWEALERSHLAHFLVESRDGLDTMIGERGVRLSGGQRQRLGIARALYTRPRLVVLDEATSALDAETERAIIKTLDALEGEVTTITVAHRLATVRRADQLLYLQKGRIISRGTFDEVRGSVEDFDRQASLLGL
jgi:ABC-type multidrug transport system fused ATPase/permease subunit